MKGVNREPGTPNYDLFRLALKSTAQRIYPNYCNCDTSMNNLEIDKKSKEDYINSLSKNNKDKLISIIEQHPELGQILNLEVVDE